MQWARHLKKRTLIYLILAVILIVTATVVIIEKNKSSSSSKTAQIQSIYSQADQNNLKSGNVTSYLDSELNYGQAYMSSHDYKAASVVIDNIKKNVPEKYWDTDTYQLLAQLAKAQGKSADYKNYTNKLIAQLKATGDTQTAQYYQKQLQGN